MSFNSLQTGKCIQSDGIMAIADQGGVSIPFKRESVFKEILYIIRLGNVSLFQFPSNGKVYSKVAKVLRQRFEKEVSIPFKRESVFKEAVRASSHRRREMFQFPSNGKVYSKSPYFKPSGAVALYA